MRIILAARTSIKYVYIYFVHATETLLPLAYLRPRIVNPLLSILHGDIRSRTSTRKVSILHSHSGITARRALLVLIY